MAKYNSGGEWSTPAVHSGDDKVSVADGEEPADDVRRQLLVRRPRNLQAPSTFLSPTIKIMLVPLCRQCLEDEASLLHSPFQYLLERLAAQKLQPDDLRYSRNNNL